MRLFNKVEQQVFKQQHPRKPITHWEASLNGKVFMVNNSIKLLRYNCKGITGVIFKSVR